MNIQQRVSLKKYNTFGVEAVAGQLVHLVQEDQLLKLYETGILQAGNYLILGGGSNVLFVKDYEGLVLRVELKGIRHRETDEGIYVTAAAGERWQDLVDYAVQRGFGGIENLSLIPGTVGASPVQNIGAYGVELKDVFDNCRAFDLREGNFVTCYKEDCQFGYRESIFKKEHKGRYLITEVNLLLSRESNINIAYGAIREELNKRGVKRPGIQDVAQVVAQIRVNKLPDPSTIGNAGSFFKNPIISEDTFHSLVSDFVDIISYPMEDGSVKLAAGWLIEQCGWKGKVVGNVGTWKNQALVLVNHGSATGLEVYEFSEAIIISVKDRFGVVLEREVNVIR